MRQFGLQILSEQLGRTAFTELSQDTKRRFSQAVTEIISYNVNLFSKLKMEDLIGSINNQSKVNLPTSEDSKDKEVNKDLVNPIVKVNLWLHTEEGELIEDSLYWDLAWNLNKPEEFAKDYCNDLKLDACHIKQVSFAIRKQIFDHLKQISLNKKYNLLKTLGIPVTRHTSRPIAKPKNKTYDLCTVEKSEFSENEMYVPK